MTLGTFCWHDLYTVHPDAARAFYNDLLGWSFRRFDDEDTPYWEIDTGHGTTGCLYTVPDTPPMWQTYISVENVATLLAKMKALGGSVLHGPLRVPNFGVIALISDTDGAMCWVIQRDQPVSSPANAQPGDFAWYALYCRDTTSAMAFYNELFGWTRGSDPATDGTATGVMLNQGAPVATLQTIDEATTASPHWAMAIAVDDVQATRTKAIDLGATLTHPIAPNGPHGQFCSIRDPVGAHISFWQPLGSTS